jgi:hypothetical protein
LKIYWIHDNYKKYVDKYLNKKPAGCKELSQKMCFNYSSWIDKSYGSKRYLHNYYISLHDKINSDYSNCMKNHIKISWNEASKLCRQAGGFLPILRSKEEMNELIALLKLSPYRADNFSSLSLENMEEIKPSWEEIKSSCLYLWDIDDNTCQITPSPEQFEFIFIGLLANGKHKASHEYMNCIQVGPALSEFSVPGDFCSDKAFFGLSVQTLIRIISD